MSNWESDRARRYREYLQSPWWQRRRQLRLEVAGHRCEFRPMLDWDQKHGGWYGERCSATRDLEVHHLRYSASQLKYDENGKLHHQKCPVLYAERDEDLEVLCCFHHLVRHVGNAECDVCGEAIYPEFDEDVVIAVVEEAVASAGGNARNVDLADIDVDHLLCDYHEHMMSKD